MRAGRWRRSPVAVRREGSPDGLVSARRYVADSLRHLVDQPEDRQEAARRIARQLWPAVFGRRDFAHCLLAVILVHSVLAGEADDVDERTRSRILDLASLPVF